ncbi:hypothetical protein Acy02nite_81930 [Actinoplanes cyaneus]|uniref:Uncharacterized protein n=1 Tax=Actinoplanes cyaneus TaxID=52696 RepID=A0A919M8Y7_9ACTN|nr:hypothetical protein Acy02nite_81930 [Actinoplanes cyaneus]
MSEAGGAVVSHAERDGGVVVQPVILVPRMAWISGRAVPGRDNRSAAAFTAKAARLFLVAGSPAAPSAAFARK